MYNICRINKKAPIVENQLQTAFHKVYNISLQLTTLKNTKFLGESGNITVTKFMVCRNTQTNICCKHRQAKRA